MSASDRRTFLRRIASLALAGAAPFSIVQCRKKSGNTPPGDADRFFFVIAEPCVGRKCGTCIPVCPVDCIHPHKKEAGFAKVDQLFIHPGECILCGNCVEVCPVEAIYEQNKLPDQWQSYREKNAKFFGLA
jgi:formate hydrogenlyase subunit 6/NADH:ubiquinone oxidoreductase subunit I